MVNKCIYYSINWCMYPVYECYITT